MGGEHQFVRLYIAYSPTWAESIPDRKLASLRPAQLPHMGGSPPDADGVGDIFPELSHTSEVLPRENSEDVPLYETSPHGRGEPPCSGRSVGLSPNFLTQARRAQCPQCAGSGNRTYPHMSGAIRQRPEPERTVFKTPHTGRAGPKRRHDVTHASENFPIRGANPNNREGSSYPSEKLPIRGAGPIGVRREA